MQVDPWFRLLLLASCAAQLGVCVVLTRRGLVRAWQGLFTLCLFATCSEVALFGLRDQYFAYFYAFWITRIVVAMLQVYLIADILRGLPGGFAISSSARRVVGLTAIALACGSCGVGWRGHGTLAHHVAASAMLLGRSVDIAWGMFAAVCLTSVGVLGMGWRLQSTRITSGFVTAMVGRVVCSYAYLSPYRIIRISANYVEMGIWSAVCIYWLVTLTTPVRAADGPTEQQMRTMRERFAHVLPGGRLSEGAGHA